MKRGLLFVGAIGLAVGMAFLFARKIGNAGEQKDGKLSEACEVRANYLRGEAYEIGADCEQKIKAALLTSSYGQPDWLGGWSLQKCQVSVDNIEPLATTACKGLN